MLLRSNNTKLRLDIEILSIICILFTIGIFIACQLDHEQDRVLPILMSGIMWGGCGLIIFQDWIIYGREITLTQEGCTVRFLGFKRFYRWDQMKTKRKIKLSIRYYRGAVSGYKGVILFHKKSWVLQKHLQFFPDLAFSVPRTFYPFSFIFIVFEPRLNPPPPDPPHWLPERMRRNWYPEWRITGKGSGYFADEKQFFALLESWGIVLEGDYKNLLY